MLNIKLSVFHLYQNEYSNTLRGGFCDLIEPGSPILQANSLPSEPPGKPTILGRQNLAKKLDMLKSINILFPT